MAIVWVCALSVDEYVASGRGVVVPRQDCPGCAAAMVFWSATKRSVRQHGPVLKLWLRRARCRRCRASHALVLSFCLVGRLDLVETIGVALDTVVSEGRGIRPVAEEADVPHTTAPDWVRRFHRRVMGAAFAVVRARAGPALPSRWDLWPTVTGGSLLATTTNPLSIVLGRRRLIHPVP